MAWTEGGWFSLGEVTFDPVIRDRLWIAEGTGVWIVSDLSDDHVTWEEVSVGQEHLVSNDAISLPGGRVITAHWDRPLFVHDDPDRYPGRHQPSRRFNSAWDLDCIPNDPDFVVAIIDDHRYCCYDDGHRQSGYSDDGGNTWFRFVSQPAPRGNDSIHGKIAVSAQDRDNIVWLPAWNELPYFTTDRGKTWKQAALPGNSGNCCIAAPWFQREAIVADRVVPHQFYLYDWAGGHVFRSSDGGESWQRFESVVPAWGYHAKIRSVPGRANHLWFAHGKQEAAKLIQGVMRSTDGGETWVQSKGTSETLNIAIGKAAPGAQYPTIYIQGRVDGEFGYFKSTDQSQTWTKIGEHPLGIYAAAKVMEADPFEHGRLYVGFDGNGFVYYDESLGGTED